MACLEASTLNQPQYTPSYTLGPNQDVFANLQFMPLFAIVDNPTNFWITFPQANRQVEPGKQRVILRIASNNPNVEFTSKLVPPGYPVPANLFGIASVIITSDPSLAESPGSPTPDLAPINPPSSISLNYGGGNPTVTRVNIPRWANRIHAILTSGLFFTSISIVGGETGTNYISMGTSGSATVENGALLSGDSWLIVTADPEAGGGGTWTILFSSDQPLPLSQAPITDAYLRTSLTLAMSPFVLIPAIPNLRVFLHDLIIRGEASAGAPVMLLREHNSGKVHWATDFATPIDRVSPFRGISTPMSDGIDLVVNETTPTFDLTLTYSQG